MTGALIVTLSIVIILSLVVIGYTVNYRKKIPCMTGMMIAMTLGMSVGLTVGVILGIQLSGNLFFSTILGILIGGATGFIAGLPVSLMAVLDGMLSGLMGGMMGAMLGEMIAIEYRDSLIKIMIVLFIAIILLLLYMMQIYMMQIYMMQTDIIKHRLRFFNHPVGLVILFGIIFIGFNQIGPIIKPESSNQEMNHVKHSQAQEKKVFVTASEYSFSPEQVMIGKGEKITVVLENIGDIEHDLEIVGLQADLPETNQKQHEHRATKNLIHVHAKPGEKTAISFTPLESGTYKFVCTIPGHKESGMIGFIKVT